VEARGFVDDGEKLHLMRRALALVHPSPYESLGIVLLEAMACRTPVIVNAASEVLVEHCRESHAGLWAADAAQFVATVRRLAADSTLRRELGACGRSYVEREYSLASYENRLLAEFPAAEG
jgi:glycosyltransferase involved in cell wall biosynthesis